MQIGINGTGLVQKASTEAIIGHATQAHSEGFGSYWLAEHPTGGFDALTVLTAVGMKIPDLKLGTAIIPTWPRHPAVLAGQATTTNNTIKGNLTLGIGLSHEPMMAELGIGFDKPIRHLKEFLAVLMPLIQEGSVQVDGEMLSASARFFRQSESDLPVLVAALGPQALRVTGRLADGTILAWVGPKTIREHIAPTLNEAAAKADRPMPQIVASLPVCVTDSEAEVRATIGKGLRMYGQLPSYRAMFDREGAEGPAEVAIVGSLAQVTDGIEAMRLAGVTEFAPTEFFTNPDEAAQTRELLVSLL
ncbi:MAG: TIGR03564 family F420-dependent LLM class oxidoreductase [Pseudomonadales bacterium]|nr:TIGR03564 family F420-dependent LLM class oxidoreductase [Pseudomonadales bacterium]